jgi:NADH-quinone oxidoreductase subunit M
LNNFASEFLVILGTFGANKVWGSIAAVGVLLSAIYFLWAYQRSMHGPLRDEHATASVRDLTRWEYLVIVPVVVVILFLGLYPKPVLERVNPATCRVKLVYQSAPTPLDCGPLPIATAAHGTRGGGWTMYAPLNVRVDGSP